MSHLPPNSLFRAWGQRQPDTTFADAIALLTADHRMIENLFAAFTYAGAGERRQRLGRQICAALRINSLIEREIMLPALIGDEADEAVDDIRIRNERTLILIAEIDPNDDDGRLRAFIDSMAGADDAFDGGLFARARAAGLDLVALRDQILARKQAEAAAPPSRRGTSP